MELSVLGKYGPYPNEKGACSGYLVKSGDDCILLDMGSGVLERLMKTCDITKIKNIFISHLHFDHTSDLLPFRYLLEVLNQDVNIYTKYDGSEWYKVLFSHPNFNVVNVDETSEIKIGSLTLNFLCVNHIDSSLAVIIKSDKTLCYTGDTAYCSNVEKCFEMSDIILADCCKPAGIKEKHMTVDDAVSLAKKHPEKLIIATHLSSDFNPEKSFEKYDNIIIAKEGETY